MSALLYQLELIADDVARLRRHTRDDEHAQLVIDRIAGRVQNIDCIVCYSAGQLVAEGEDVDRALNLVDSRARQIRRLLGEKPR
jgi:hypothetical protein